MKCPCKDCITLPACKNEDVHILVRKCCNMKKYLGVTHIKTNITEDRRHVVYTIRSNHMPLVHKYKLSQIKKFIPHSYIVD